jgi:hypothetical protein
VNRSEDPVFSIAPLTIGVRIRILSMHLPPTRHAERPRVGLFLFRGHHAP